MKIRKEIGLSFDDVLLVPRRSTIKSRFDPEAIDLSVRLTPHIKLKRPLITAAMDTVTESVMVNKISELGGLGIMHRFMNDADYENEYLRISNDTYRVAGIGLGQKSLGRLNDLYAAKQPPVAVHIDVAYAHTPFMKEFVGTVKEKYQGLDVIVGSVATGEGVVQMCDAGVDAIRVGVGPGSMCTTRITTGNGVPQLTALIEAREAIDYWNKHHNFSGRKVSIICDGGVKSGGDIVKALAAGADAVMSGNLFAGTDESPGNIVESEGGKRKLYRGMSSKAAQLDWKGSASSVEGEITYIPYKGPVENVFNDLVGNILSGMSYQDAHNIQELNANAEFVRITTAGMQESKPHGKVY